MCTAMYVLHCLCDSSVDRLGLLDIHIDALSGPLSEFGFVFAYLNNSLSII